MRIAVPDLVTNSYFPALAAEELGLYRAEGVDAHVDLLAPALGAMAALKAGDVELVVTGAHTTLTAFPGWQGAKLAVAARRRGTRGPTRNTKPRRHTGRHGNPLPVCAEQ